ncbi:Lrp/AsnC family transcriptional regulator [Bacillus kexueae]|uniref:Lrp/AsnC family transcriptional regulator n=1 Tax=Aeribacillus kexueae TaxID=2078952 RepID=UPI001FAFD454|nr:Lrp/AsnC family transcriptional regulator [Bacillus kexueae]
MDKVDYQIIKALMENGRMTWAELASNIDLSSPAVKERVLKLSEAGVIKEFGVIVDHEKVGTECTAFVLVTLEKPTYRHSFLQLVNNLEEVQECHHIAGEDDYLLKIRCRNTKELDRVISFEIKGLEGIVKTKTTIVMNTEKETVKIPIQHDYFGKKD